MEKHLYTFLHKVHKLINPRILDVGSDYQTIVKFPVSLIRAAPDSSNTWNSADTIDLKQGTVLNYRGTIKSHHLKGDLDPKFLVFEIKSTLPELDLEGKDTLATVVGDMVAISPKNRRDIFPAPKA